MQRIDSTSTPRHRRWKKRPRTVTMLASDVIVWTAFSILTGIVLLACCALLTLAWPS